MEDSRSNRKPGDLILDRCMPDANAAEREEARANLYALAAVVLRICTRLAHEQHRLAIRRPADGAVELPDGP